MDHASLKMGHKPRHTGPDKQEGGRPPSADFTKPLNPDDSRANQRLNGTPIPPRQPCFTSSSNLGVFMETNEGMSSKRSSFDRAPKLAHKLLSSRRWHVMKKAGGEEAALPPPGRAVGPGLCRVRPPPTPWHHRSRRAPAQGASWGRSQGPWQAATQALLNSIKMELWAETSTR